MTALLRLYAPSIALVLSSAVTAVAKAVWGVGPFVAALVLLIVAAAVVVHLREARRQRKRRLDA